jgi:hypothetical protein
MSGVWNGSDTFAFQTENKRRNRFYEISVNEIIILKLILNMVQDMNQWQAI